MSTTSAPRWDLDTKENYDHYMECRCKTVIERLKNDKIERQQLYADPRSIHRELHVDLTPIGYSDYAGTYRGTIGSSVEHKKAYSKSDIPGNNEYEFTLPENVAAEMATFATETRELIDAVMGGPYDQKITVCAMIFVSFGSIHPFLDGNGHVQRLMFECIAYDFAIPLGAHWRIHPRPYSALFGVALEFNQKFGLDTINLITEYLNLFTLERNDFLLPKRSQ